MRGRSATPYIERYQDTQHGHPDPRVHTGKLGAVPARPLPQRSAAQEDVSSKTIEVYVERIELEADLSHQRAPFRAWEKAVSVAIVDEAGLTTGVPNQNREAHEILGVARGGIGDPLQETHAALVRVIASMVRVLDKRLANLVWDDHPHTTRSQVLECRLHHGAKLCLGRH